MRLQIMDLYSVYIHTFPNGKVYIGITSQKPEQRWQNGNGYKFNKHLNNAIKKYGWENVKHDILFSKLTMQDAKSKEIYLIDKYQSANSKFGYNISLGGDVPSAETKAKISSSHIGIRPSEETRLKMRNAKLGKKQSPEIVQKRIMRGEKNPMYGKVVSKQKREYLRNLFKGKPAHKNTVEANKVKIAQYLKSGEFIRKFDSIKEASEILNIPYQKICHNCNGHQKFVGEYIFKHF